MSVRGLYLQINETVFNKEKELITTSRLIEMEPEALQQMWYKAAKHNVQDKSPEDEPQMSCRSYAVPILNSTHIGKNGILRKLLIHRAHHSAYASCPALAVISYKWMLFGKKMVLIRGLKHGFLAACFSLFCLTFKDLSSELRFPEKGCYTARQAATQASLFLSCIVGAYFLAHKAMQAEHYWRENSWKGISHWASSGWNWLDIASSAILVMFIPILVVLMAFNSSMRASELLLICIAVESMLLWWKLLHTILPFRCTGALVISVTEIMKDVKYFLFLGLMVIVGFAVAFFVSFKDIGHEGLELSEGEETLQEYFGNFGITLTTLFSFMLGDADVHVLMAAHMKNNFAIVCLFVLYMSVMSVLLLNLLIAILGDSFERVKESEEMHFFKARASAIDEEESYMSPAHIARIE